jgi:hypothetical protein
MGKSIHIFCCYTHTDKEFLEALKKHLQPLLRRGLIHLWSDTDIGPGMQWETEIDAHLEMADVILLLVSADFVNSDYCYSNELRKAMDLHFAGKARVVPIILRPVHWSMTDFGKLQALPTHAIPIASASWRTQDEAYLDIVEGIRQIAEELVNNDRAPSQFSSLSTGKDFFSQALVSTAIATGNVPPIISHAIQLLDSLDKAERKTAIDTLAQANHPVAREALFTALQHVLRDVRIHTASYLLHESQAIPALLETLYEKEQEARQRAIHALVKMGKKAVPALIEALEISDINMQLQILEVFGK